MPNWVANRICIIGNEEDVKALKDNVLVKNENHIDFDFNKIIPMPQELHIECSTKVDRGIKLIEGTLKREDLKLNDEEYEEYIKLGQQALDNLKNYGYKDWYDWSIDNWGTKWNACDTFISGDYISFNTAWSSPLELMLELSKQYPNVILEYAYAEEQIGYWAGDMKIQNGVIIDGCKEYEEDSVECYEVGFELWGCEECYEFNEEIGTYRYIEE